MKNMEHSTAKQRISAIIFSITLLLFSVANVSLAKDVTLAWDANQESDVAGYKVYYGTNPGTYTGTEANSGPSPVEMGSGDSATFVGLDDTKTHYFTVTAFNFNGEESAYANEVNAPPLSNNDLDGDGYDLTVDCDDYNAEINPGATEIYNNGVDENCNGMDDDVLIVAPGGAIEAESGNLVAPMQMVADSAATNGSYIQTNTGSSGSASYNFNISAPGIYKVVARAFAADGNSNSFFVNINNAGEFVWTLAADNAWSSSEVSSNGITYELDLQNGTHSISFRGREANTKLDYFQLVKVGEITIADVDQDGYDQSVDCNDNNSAINPGVAEVPGNGIDENCNGMDDDVLMVAPGGAIEAESGNLVAPMQMVADSAATNGSYIQTSTGSSGSASYNFYISAPGIYKVVARAFAADGSSNSFFVNIDNAGEFVWTLAADNAWSSSEVSSNGITYELDLQNGTHSISFRGREANTKLDYFQLVKVGEITIADVDQDGYDQSVDCNDNNFAINPGATEVPYNGIDENCNGMADDTAADTVAPTITIITPDDGTTLKGRWSTIRVEATDDIMVMKTEIYIDGKLALEEPGNIAQSNLDLKTISNGSHTISAKAYDQAGNVATRGITVVK